MCFHMSERPRTPIHTCFHMLEAPRHPRSPQETPREPQDAPGGPQDTRGFPQGSFWDLFWESCLVDFRS